MVSRGRQVTQADCDIVLSDVDALRDRLDDPALVFGGKTLLQTQIDTLRSCGITDISVVRGYRGDKICYPGIKYYENPDYEDNNILESIMKAKDELSGDVIVSYADIWYEADVLKDYGIGDEGALHLVFRSGEKEAAHLLFGTRKTGRGDNFVRRSGENAVYAVAEDVLSDFGFTGKVEAEKFDPSTWFDKTLVRFDPEKVTFFKLAEGGLGEEKSPLSLFREEAEGRKQWKSTEGYAFTPSAGKIKDYLKRLSAANAKKIIALEEAAGLDESDWRFEIGLEDGSVLEITRGAEDGEGNFAVGVSGPDYAYLVAGFVLDRFQKTDGDFFVENPLQADETKTGELVLHDETSGKDYRLKKHKETVPAAGGEGEAQEEKQVTVWKTPEGNVVKEDDIKDLFGRLKRLEITTASGVEAPRENACRLVFGGDPDEEAESFSYIFSAKSEGDAGEYYFLRMPGDHHTYATSPYRLDAVRDAFEAAVTGAAAAETAGE